MDAEFEAHRQLDRRDRPFVHVLRIEHDEIAPVFRPPVDDADHIAFAFGGVRPLGREHGFLRAGGIACEPALRLAGRHVDMGIGVEEEAHDRSGLLGIVGLRRIGRLHEGVAVGPADIAVVDMRELGVHAVHDLGLDMVAL